MPAEALAHRRQHLFRESVLAARAEAGVERGRQHVGRHRLLDRRHDGPAAFAGILDEAREAVELRILRQRARRQIEQPGTDDAAAPPHFGDVGQIEIEALVRRQGFADWRSCRMSKPSA